MTNFSGAQRFGFASGANHQYIEQLYRQYQGDPTSVDPSWQKFFEGVDFAEQGDAFFARKPAEGDSTEAKVEAYIHAFRRFGHRSANLNPLEDPKGKSPNSDVMPETHGLSGVADDRVFHPANVALGDKATFGEIKAFLQETYCGSIGADFRELNSIEAVLWLQEQMESCRNKPVFDQGKKRRILGKLVAAEGFERFLHDRYLGQKRFSIEGLESLIPLLDQVAAVGSEGGVEELTLGMAHRGRLNVLANFLGKPYEKMLSEFEGSEKVVFDIDGDVKYHMGYANKIKTEAGKELRLYLSPNPSHLEAVNPVVEGFTRSRQRELGDEARDKVLPILIHGDASFIGQGIVAETLNLSELKAYHTGGTIHIIANNQIGFTTDPEDSRSCEYSSDICKMIRAPVFHVNADDPEAVVWTAELAVKFRQKFKKDVVIDLVGYRRHGHNETDEPSYTQPGLYKVIKNHTTVLNRYGQALEKSGVISKAEFEAQVKEFRSLMQSCQDQVRSGGAVEVNATPKELVKSMRFVKVSTEEIFKSAKTSIPQKKVKDIGKAICSYPNEFTPHPKIVKLYKSRLEMFEGDGAIDWGTAELLAYGSLAIEGHHVRLSGQDCGRGTFSHRQAVLHDFSTGEKLEVMNTLSPGQAKVDIINSPLSEAGVLGFEFGYSVADPDALVLWEAQFGDFANGAQIIMDQFLVASEAKWKQQSGIVLLLPHGYEGMGPEHSSARPERFLQSCGNLNIQVANVTTPAQIFHILRRQMKRNFRKPLVIMTPKSLLRHPRAVSTIKDFSSGSFTETIDDVSNPKANKVERVVFCTGKIYYELEALRDEHKDLKDQVAIVRVEQIYPFPRTDIESIFAKYKNLKEVLWTQEEPSNMGAWTFVRHRIKRLLPRGSKFRYSGRQSSGTTAEGSLKAHQAEQSRILHDTLGLACPIAKSE